MAKITMREHRDVLVRWLRAGKAEAPSWQQLEAIRSAIAVMKALADDWEDYEAPIGILTYHRNHPTALLMRDPATIRAFKAAVDAMERRITRRG